MSMGNFDGSCCREQSFADTRIPSLSLCPSYPTTTDRGGTYSTQPAIIGRGEQLQGSRLPDRWSTRKNRSGWYVCFFPLRFCFGLCPCFSHIEVLDATRSCLLTLPVFPLSLL